MLQMITRRALGRAGSRFAVAVTATVVGVLAVGDALGVIRFPLYQLGLPNTAVANTAVLLLGVALLAGAYRLVGPGVGLPASSRSGKKPATDGAGEYDDRDPEQILRARYARGELTDAEFETMRSRLADYDMEDDTEAEHAREFAENHTVDDRQTIID